MSGGTPGTRPGLAVLARGDDPPEPPAALRAPLRYSPTHRPLAGHKARTRCASPGTTPRNPPLRSAPRCGTRRHTGHSPGTRPGLAVLARGTTPRNPPLRSAPRCGTRRHTGHSPGTRPGLAVLARGDDPPEPPAALRAPLRYSPTHRPLAGHKARTRCASPGGRPPGTPRCAPRPAAVLADTPATRRAQGPDSLGRYERLAVPPLRFANRGGNSPAHRRSPVRKRRWIL